jgi:hypothetical protein
MLKILSSHTQAYLRFQARIESHGKWKRLGLLKCPQEFKVISEVDMGAQGNDNEFLYTGKTQLIPRVTMFLTTLQHFGNALTNRRRYI